MGASGQVAQRLLSWMMDMRPFFISPTR